MVVPERAAARAYRGLAVASPLHCGSLMQKTARTIHSQRLIPLALALGLAGGIGGTLLLQPNTTVAQTRAPAQAQAQTTTMVHLSKYGSDFHAVLMALESARSVQQAGGNVTLLLDLEGVRLADKRIPSDVAGHPHIASVHQIYDEVVKGGGQVLVCAHCASVAGIDKGSLKSGARLSSGQEFGRAIREATQILDY